MHKCEIIATFVAETRKITMQSHQNNKNDSLFSSLCSPHNTPIAMGILNCTPDSFYEGSRKQTESEIAERACEIIREGGQIIDIGAFSTRPGAQPVSEAEELRRMRNALEVVRRELPDAVLSVDTYRPVVARMATDEFGVQIINDVSEGGLTGITGVELDERLTDGNVPDMFREVARSGACYILMSVQKDISAMIGNFRRELDILYWITIFTSEYTIFFDVDVPESPLPGTKNVYKGTQSEITTEYSEEVELGMSAEK